MLSLESLLKQVKFEHLMVDVVLNLAAKLAQEDRARIEGVRLEVITSMHFAGSSIYPSGQISNWCRWLVDTHGTAKQVKPEMYLDSEFKVTGREYPALVTHAQIFAEFARRKYSSYLSLCEQNGVSNAASLEYDLSVSKWAAVFALRGLGAERWIQRFQQEYFNAGHRDRIRLTKDPVWRMFFEEFYDRLSKKEAESIRQLYWTGLHSKE